MWVKKKCEHQGYESFDCSVALWGEGIPVQNPIFSIIRIFKY
jgi:hypothetical protein